MRLFCWLSAVEVPADLDLRRCGWLLVEDWRADPASANAPLLAHTASMDAARWVELLRGIESRRRILLVGVSDPQERARLLHLGFGDVLGDTPSLAELDARAARVALQAESLPRYRQLGRLRLDLFHRDGFVDTRPLGLHPREFALLWRLSDTPLAPVSLEVLLAQVWRIFHPPETNRVAVHVFRLRAKLAIAGLDGLVQTAPGGGYFFAPHGARALDAPSFLAAATRLDELRILGEVRAESSGQGEHHDT